MPVIPAPNYEDFDVASDEQVAKDEYKDCKRIWIDAFSQAQKQTEDIAYHLLVMREYYRAAEQIRHRYQSHYKRPIDPDDTLMEWPEPTYTPNGQVIQPFETVDQIYARLYKILCERYPHLAAHWRE